MPSVQGTQDQQNADGFPFFRPLDGGHLAASDFNPWRMLCLISVPHFCASFQENHKMPESNVWPPKPDLPDPLTEYDEVIAAKLDTYLIVFRNEAVMRQTHHHAAFMALVRLEIVIVAATMLLALASTIISGIIRRESRKKG